MSTLHSRYKNQWMNVFGTIRPLLLIPLVAAGMLSGCGSVGIPTTSATTPTQPTSVAASLGTSSTPVDVDNTLLTEPQDGWSPWLTAIQQATQTLDVNDYLLTDSAYIAALKAAAARGVLVHVIIDGHPYDDASAVSQTEAAFRGSEVQVKVAPARFEGAYAFDHAKYLVVDPGLPTAVAILGSPNGTASAFDGTNAEDAIATTNPAITTALAEVFHADWTGTRAGTSPRRVLVLSPGSQDALVGMLNTSGPVAITTEELGDAPALYQALDAHGSTARVLVPVSLSASDQAEAQRLVAAGVQVRTLSTPYVHAKLIVTAHQTFVGSQNLSDVSLQDNREVGIIVSTAQIHLQALAWFNALWAHATPFGHPAAASLPSSGKSPLARTTWPYLPDGDTPAQVTALWGSPTSVGHNTYHGHPQTVWIYSVGRVDFQQGRVTAVQRTS